MYAQCKGKTAKIFLVTDVRLHSDEKTFCCDLCDKIFFPELISQNTLGLRNLWLPLKWQQIFRTLMSKYTQMKNHLAATHVTRIFLNSHIRIHSEKETIWLPLIWKEIFQNALPWEIIWLPLVWQETCQTHVSKYTQMKTIRLHSVLVWLSNGFNVHSDVRVW